LYIQFFPTFRCNESCAFCFNRGISQVTDIELSDFGKLADILAGEGIQEIDILGGEPTLHPDLISLIGIACEKGLHVSMSTNGSDVHLLTTLSEKFGRDLLTIGLSLNDKPIEDAVSSYIHEYKPLLKSVCTSDRFLPESAARFIDLPGILYYVIFMDALHSDDLGMSLPFPQYYRDLQDFRDRHSNIEGVYCACFLPDIGDQPLLEGMRCPAGTTKLSVMPDGSVYPCYLLFRMPEFRLGNILFDKLDQILKNPVLAHFRNFTGSNCPRSACELFSRCHGGCPAVSLMVCGDLNAPDPRCYQQARSGKDDRQ
jgi:radical SAM protein with 4Fe4S-binding SPASM domain